MHKIKLLKCTHEFYTESALLQQGGHFRLSTNLIRQ